MAALLYVSPAAAVYLVNSSSQTGQCGQAVYVHLTAVGLSSHQVGSVKQWDNIIWDNNRASLCSSLNDTSLILAVAANNHISSSKLTGELQNIIHFSRELTF